MSGRVSFGVGLGTARDEILDRVVALKVMRPQYADDDEFIERFRREAQNAASLSHPNIVAVFERRETGSDIHYIVMEYMPGGTLRDLIRNDGPLPHGRVVAIAIQISRALQLAHERGIVHRDVKRLDMLDGTPVLDIKSHVELPSG